MAIDTRTPAERAYDATRLSYGPSADPTMGTDVTDEMIALFERMEQEQPEAPTQELLTQYYRQPYRKPEDDDEPFGTLRDGTPIVGVREPRAAEHFGRAGIVHAQIGDLRLAAQDEPSLFTVDGFGPGIRLDDMTIEQINALRAFLATDAPEQLLAAAAAYGRGDVQPPEPPEQLVSIAAFILFVLDYPDEWDAIEAALDAIIDEISSKAAAKQ